MLLLQVCIHSTFMINDTVDKIVNMPLEQKFTIQVMNASEMNRYPSLVRGVVIAQQNVVPPNSTSAVSTAKPSMVPPSGPSIFTTFLNNSTARGGGIDGL